MATIGENVTGGTAGSVLFIDSAVKLAQDNAGFYFEAGNNTLKSADAASAASSQNFAVSSGTGGENTSGTGSAGNSGTVTVNTGAGGSGSNGSLSGNSGNLLLKTGVGGGNAQTGLSGGNAGHIILQPGNGGSGTIGSGVGGSTIVRASSGGGDILAVQNSAGTTTHMAVNNSGRLRVGTGSSGALLQLGAGTSTLPPLKFTSGTNLTSPQAGAVEFDGTDVFITNSSNRRRYLTSDMANVLDFGAKGDGSTDDSAAFQAAVGSLVETGGIVWVPPNRKYVVANVTVSAKYPVWIMSGMGNHTLGGASNTTFNASASIAPPPPPATPTHIFQWARHTNIGQPGAGAGGGIASVVLADIAATGGTPNRSTTIGTAALWVDDALDFTIRDCAFEWLKGTALRVDESTYCRVRTSRFYKCGDIPPSPDPERPVIDMGGQATQGFVWTDGLSMENNEATHIRVQTKGGLVHHNSYHEDSGSTTKSTFVDATSGAAHLHGCSFNATDKTSVILGAVGANWPAATIQNCSFNNSPGANATIKVLLGADWARLSNIHITGVGQTGPCIDVSAHWCQLDNIFTISAGRINIAGLHASLSNICMYAPNAGDGQYCVDFNTAAYGVLNGGFIDGVNGTLADGVRAFFSTVKGMRIRRLGTGANGIVSTSADDVIADNWVGQLNGGAAFVYVNGTNASGNTGFPKTASDDNSDDAVTLNAESGSITTKSLSTAAGGSYTLTLINSLVLANSTQVVASCDYGGGVGGGTTGRPIIGYCATWGSGQVLIQLINNHPTESFNGTYKIHFKVLN